MKAFHDFYDRLTWKYMLQLNYWRGPIDACLAPLAKSGGGAGPPAPPGSTPLRLSAVFPMLFPAVVGIN